MSLQQSRYRIESLLGRGGMGTVERAVDIATGRVVALKRLLLGDVDEDKRKRVVTLFEREYHVLSQLSHPGIVEVYDYGVDDLGPYYTMELLDGDDISKRAPLAWRDACALMRDVASSLAIIHARGFVHRDVTPMNVRCTSDGRATLIDFGAMCPMGVAKNLVGTPPFVPPEAVQHTALDGRTDLFALGASLYYVLTDRHAYPARNFPQLRDAWRSAPPSPTQLNPEVPQALSLLVLQLISPAAVSRPTSAAEVYERLTGIAGLPRGEHLDVAKAYLKTPSLMGRASVQSRCSTRLLKAVAGRGSTLLMSGEAGAGRSRLLDAVALEALLLGALVLRADDTDVRADGFGLLERLATELLRVRAQAREQVDDELLARFLDSLQQPKLEPAHFPRGKLLEAFSSWLGKVSQRFVLVIAIDDLQLLDEPALATVASLANEAQRARILVVTTVERDAATCSDAAYALISSLATAVELEALSQEDLHAMLASAFGDVANLSVLSTVLYRVCSGNPGATMEHARDLVDAKTVRYEDGVWMIPSQPEELERIVLRPTGVTERLRELSDDARALAQLMALDHHEILGSTDYAALSTHGQSARMHAALDALVQAKILAAHGGGFSFARQNHRAEIVQAIDEDTRRQLHARLAARLSNQPQHAVAYALHAARSGDLEGAQQATLQYLKTLNDAGARLQLGAGALIETCEEVLRRSVAAGAARDKLVVLRLGIVNVASGHAQWERVRDHAELTFADVAHYAGLTDYHELRDVPEAERLMRALTAAQARYDATPEHERGLSIEDGIKSLSRLVLSVASAAWSLIDQRLISAVPSLAPLAPLSPALGLIDRVRIAIYDMVHGALIGAWAGFRALWSEIQQPLAGVDPILQAQLRSVVLAFTQGIDAVMGIPHVLERAHEVERFSRRLAESERFGYYLAIGDAQAAAATRTRMELLQVQGGDSRHDPTHWGAEMAMCAASGDLVGFKRCIDEAARMQRTRPEWELRRKLAEAAHTLGCGAVAEAHVLLQKLFHELPEIHADRDALMNYYLSCLLQQAQYQQVKEVGIAFLEHRPRAVTYLTSGCVAMAEALLGELEPATRRIENVINELVAHDVHGIFLGNTYDTAARIALQRGDQKSFQTYAALCGQEFKSGRNSGLTRRYEALMETARQHEVAVSTALAQAAQFTMHAQANEFIQKLHTEMRTRMEPADRYQSALRMLIESSGAAGGFLYMATPAGLPLVASDGSLPRSDALDADVHWYWQVEVVARQAEDELQTTADKGFETTTATGEGDDVESAAPPVDAVRRFVAGDLVLRPFLLTGERGRTTGPWGMLLLVEAGGRRLITLHTMLDAVADVLAGTAEGVRSVAG